MKPEDTTRANIKVHGIVQGVGFRPFIHRLVKEHSLSGWIRNTFYGAEIEAEGKKDNVSQFIYSIKSKAPKLSVIEKIDTEYFEETKNYRGFEIIESRGSDIKDTLISPDICVCDDCLREMFDPENRRHLYPFINCTNCGPRFTIIKDIPYDRDKTTMAPFHMCGDCNDEYTNIENRRYHAEPVCCLDCGPQLVLLDGNGKQYELGEELRQKNDSNGENRTESENNIKNTETIKITQKLLESGKIAAIKGIGGIHLACLYDSPEIALRLRKRKERDEKPFALMVKDAETAKKLCFVSEDEEKILTGFRRPIVLLKKKDRSAFRYLSENNYLGVMLPYTPLHYLLFEDATFDGLIMTSANLSDRPIMYKNSEAVENLKGIADAFLLNDREIETRCDDSLVWIFEGKEYFARRSRGYVPFPIKIYSSEEKKAQVAENRTMSEEKKMTDKKTTFVFHILACGGEQKASFALGKNEYIFPSQHIGDLKNAEVLENYENQIKHFERMFSIKPEIIACDLHPDYLSTEYAEARAKKEGLKLVKVQHHHAHMAACMADNGLNEPCIGIIWDGTGLGSQEKKLTWTDSDECPDNKKDEALVWGGEFLVGDYSGFKRVGTIKPFRLTGGDKATKEIWRCGVSLIYECDPADKIGRYNTENNYYKEQIAHNNGKKDSCYKYICKKIPEDQIKTVQIMLEKNINCPYCTSMGRLFDGVASILGIKSEVSYEGQGAVLLEATALEDVTEIFPYRIIKEDKYYFDYSEMLAAICDMINNSRMHWENPEENICSKSNLCRKENIFSTDNICLSPITEDDDLDSCAITGKAPSIQDDDIIGKASVMFMNTLVNMAVEMSKLIRNDTGLNKIVLSGGTFQNQYMLKRLCKKLREEDFEVYHHRQVSANDEGISLGQIMVAEHMTKLI